MFDRRLAQAVGAVLAVEGEQEDDRSKSEMERGRWTVLEQRVATISSEPCRGRRVVLRLVVRSAITIMRPQRLTAWEGLAWAYFLSACWARRWFATSNAETKYSGIVVRALTVD